MKKLLLTTLVVAALSSAALAQSPVKFGIKAGVSFPNMSLSAENVSIAFNSKTSFYVGGIADIPLSKIISFQPGLTFTGKGTRLNGAGFDFENGDVAAETGTINSSYIEVPLNLLANIEAGNAGTLFFGAGPYYAIAVDAYAKSGGVKEDITIGSDEDSFRRGDFGINFLAGFKLNNGLNIHGGYGLGLRSVIPNQDGFDVTFKNKVFSVGLGFNF